MGSRGEAAEQSPGAAASRAARVLGRGQSRCPMRGGTGRADTSERRCNIRRIKLPRCRPLPPGMAGPDITVTDVLSKVELAGPGARVPCFGHVHGDRSRCRRDPHRLPRGGRAVGHHQAAAALPGDHRPCPGTGLRPHHRRLAAAARDAVLGGAAASWLQKASERSGAGLSGHSAAVRHTPSDFGLAEPSISGLFWVGRGCART